MLLAFLPACSANVASPSRLFEPGEQRLSPDAERQITAAFRNMFPQAPDSLEFVDPNCGNVDPAPTIIDLNDDGTFEVFILWGNTCTSGMAGRSLSLFLPDANGEYRHTFGFPAAGWTVLEQRQDNWPELRFDGPGFCHAVWAWQSGDYAFKCSQPEQPGGCATRNNVCSED